PVDLVSTFSSLTVSPKHVDLVTETSVTNCCCACTKRVKYMGFRCRCGSIFCAAHRYPEKHACTFDYKTIGRDAIAKANPRVGAEKPVRI
ncbi:hypothetical protein GIB67_023663, partial [Kingdonia uniflora]